MAPRNKKNQIRALSRPSAAEPSENYQEGGPPDSGTAVASAKAVQNATQPSKNFQGGGPPDGGAAVASAKAAQNVIPKAVKGTQAGVGYQGVSMSYGNWS